MRTPIPDPFVTLVHPKQLIPALVPFAPSLKNHLGNEGANGVTKASADNTLIGVVFMRRTTFLITFGTEIKEALTIVDGCAFDTSFGEELKVVIHALKIAYLDDIETEYCTNLRTAFGRVLATFVKDTVYVSSCNDLKASICILWVAYMPLCGDKAWANLVLKNKSVAMFPLFAKLGKVVTIDHRIKKLRLNMYLTIC